MWWCPYTASKLHEMMLDVAANFSQNLILEVNLNITCRFVKATYSSSLNMKGTVQLRAGRPGKNLILIITPWSQLIPITYYSAIINSLLSCLSLNIILSRLIGWQFKVMPLLIEMVSIPLQPYTSCNLKSNLYKIFPSFHFQETLYYTAKSFVFAHR